MNQQQTVCNPQCGCVSAGKRKRMLYVIGAVTVVIGSHLLLCHDMSHPQSHSAAPVAASVSPSMSTYAR